jgi:hypothetical protein
MRGARFLFKAMALTALSSAAMGQVDSKPGSEDVIMGAWSNPVDCNRTNATRLTISQLLTRVERYRGSCVSVEGYWFRRALFESSREARSKKSNVSRRLRHRRVGLYARPEVLEAGPAQSRRYVIVGRVGTCATQWPGAMMVMGYCHYTEGPILLVSEVFKPVARTSANHPLRTFERDQTPRFKSAIESDKPIF